jgi:Gram-negative bacterial TonB protein C-terminal
MFRCVVVLALLLAFVVDSQASDRKVNAAPPPPAPGGQTPSGLSAEIADRLRSATAVLVYRVTAWDVASCVMEPGAKNDAILCQRIEATAPSPGERWSRDMAEVLGSVTTSNRRPGFVFQPEFAIRFQSEGVFTDVLLSLRQEHFLLASTGNQSLQGRPRVPPLKYLRLMADAWPQDESIRNQIRIEEEELEQAHTKALPLHPLWPDCEPVEEASFVYYEDEPVPIEAPQPDFPPGAVATHGGGKVTLHVFVDKRGKVCYARAIQGEPPFVAHAIDTVKRWVFRPAMSNGKPVGVWVEIPFRVP